MNEIQHLVHVMKHKHNLDLSVQTLISGIGSVDLEFIIKMENSLTLRCNTELNKEDEKWINSTKHNHNLSTYK